MINQNEIKRLFTYIDGELYWNINRASVRIGDRAGCTMFNSYKKVGVNNKEYYLHHLVWLYHKGRLPKKEIDHIDGNPSNNRIENLRHASSTENKRNCQNSKNNTSGVKGVTWNKRESVWAAFIWVDYHNCFLGAFQDFQEAVLHRLAAEQCLDWNINIKRSPAYQYAIKHNLINNKGTV